MNIRTSYDYASPATLAAIIHDALACISGDAASMHKDAVNAMAIVIHAWYALVANASTEVAMDELIKAGIGPDEMDWIWS